MKTGLILLSHGSRLPEAQITLQRLIAQVKTDSDFDYLLGASLQFNQPDLSTAMVEMASAGMEKVVIVPLFLCMGVHMKKDIPNLLQEERAKHPHMEIVMTGNIGADQKLIQIILDRIREAG